MSNVDRLKIIFYRHKIIIDKRKSAAYTSWQERKKIMSTIIAKDPIKHFIISQVSIQELAKRLEVAHSTLYSVYNGNGVSSELVAKLLDVTGFDFEKGFETKQ